MERYSPMPFLVGSPLPLWAGRVSVGMVFPTLTTNIRDIQLVTQKSLVNKSLINRLFPTFVPRTDEKDSSCNAPLPLLMVFRCLIPLKPRFCSPTPSSSSYETVSLHRCLLYFLVPALKVLKDFFPQFLEDLPLSLCSPWIVMRPPRSPFFFAPLIFESYPPQLFFPCPPSPSKCWAHPIDLSRRFLPFVSFFD